jgi:flagellar hook-associated protein 3 FlgL
MPVNSVSSATLSGILQNAVTRMQVQMTTLQTESTTGRLADIGLSLGAGSGQVIALHQQYAELDALTTSNALVSTQLDTAYLAATNMQKSATDVLSQVLTTMGKTPASQGALALQKTAKGALEGFVAQANTAVGGVYVFGGINTGVAPFADYTDTGAAQQTVKDAFFNTFGFSVTDSANVNAISAADMTDFLEDQFAAVFSDANGDPGADWTASWSSANSTAVNNRIGFNLTQDTSITANDKAFRTMAQGLAMLTEFSNINLNDSTYSAMLSSAQKVMQSASDDFIERTAALGVMQQAMDRANSQISLHQDVLTKQINAKEAVDPYKVASEVTALTNQLQVAYSLTAQLHKLSLVNFL